MTDWNKIYRTLNAGETIQMGDEWLDYDGIWKPTRAPGDTIEARYPSYRRPLESKNGIDECAYNGYRWVKIGEELWSTDEYYEIGEWVPIHSFESIEDVKCALGYTYRRKLEHEKPVAVLVSPVSMPPRESFNPDWSYCVTQGEFADRVFSPIKVSRCGQWAWIHFNTRVHLKHTTLVSHTKTLKPYSISKVLEARKDAQAMAVEAERVNFSNHGLWSRIKSLFS